MRSCIGVYVRTVRDSLMHERERKRQGERGGEREKESANEEECREKE